MSRGRGQRQKKRSVAAVAVVGALMLAWRLRSGKGSVAIGPVTVTSLPPVKLGKATDADVQHLTLALTRSRQVMGADPNTLASRKPSPAEEQFVRETLQLGERVSTATSGVVPRPLTETEMLALAVKLPGDTLMGVNRQLYDLLGVDPQGSNEPSVPLTPAIEAAARALIAKWRPYSTNAVTTLYAQLDLARELGGQA